MLPLELGYIQRRLLGAPGILLAIPTDHQSADRLAVSPVVGARAYGLWRCGATAGIALLQGNPAHLLYLPHRGRSVYRCEGGEQAPPEVRGEASGIGVLPGRRRARWPGSGSCRAAGSDGAGLVSPIPAHTGKSGEYCLPRPERLLRRGNGWHCSPYNRLRAHVATAERTHACGVYDPCDRLPHRYDVSCLSR